MRSRIKPGGRLWRKRRLLKKRLKHLGPMVVSLFGAGHDRELLRLHGFTR